MFAISVRDRPCSARTGPSSFGRVTRMTPSSRTTSMGSATVCRSVPFGPSTVTSRPSTVTCTPLGMVTGSRPILDIAAPPLPDVGEDFPAHATLLGLLVGQEPARRGDDRHAEAAEDPGQVVLLRVDAQPRLGDPLDARDGALARVPVLQGDHQVPADFGVFDAPGGDVTLLLEDLRDVGLDLRIRHAHGVVVRRVRVPQTREHVRDRIGHSHGQLAFLTAVSPAGPTVFACLEFFTDLVVWSLPARLGDAGQFAAVRHRAEADPAQAEPAVDRTRPPAAGTPRVPLHLELGGPLLLDDQRLLRHLSPLPEGEAEPPQQ